MKDCLHNINVLVVDDDPLIAMDISTTIEEANGHVIGPVRTVEAALAQLERQDSKDIDVAVLDINLGPLTSDPVARRLETLGIPFILYTGIQPSDLTVTAQINAPVVSKPAEPDTVRVALVDVVDKAKPSRS